MRRAMNAKKSAITSAPDEKLGSRSEKSRGGAPRGEASPCHKGCSRRLASVFKGVTLYAHRVPAGTPRLSALYSPLGKWGDPLGKRGNGMTARPAPQNKRTAELWRNAMGPGSVDVIARTDDDFLIRQNTRKGGM